MDTDWTPTKVNFLKPWDRIMSMKPWPLSSTFLCHVKQPLVRIHPKSPQQSEVNLNRWEPELSERHQERRNRFLPTNFDLTWNPKPPKQAYGSSNSEETCYPHSKIMRQKSLLWPEKPDTEGCVLLLSILKLQDSLFQIFFEVYINLRVSPCSQNTRIWWFQESIPHH